jgi:hypothetical protein
MFLPLIDTDFFGGVKFSLPYGGRYPAREETRRGGTLTEQNGRGAFPARNGTDQELQPQTVVLLSNEPGKREVFDRAMGADQRLIVATDADELRGALDPPPDTVVIDLPASERLQAWERVRARHTGMVLIAVDSQAETENWPPDLARRFLVRPLHSDEVAAALAVRPRILREPPAARRRRLAQARRPPVVPPPAPAAELPAPPQDVEPPRRLSSDESLWEETGAPAPAANGAAAAPASGATGAAGPGGSTGPAPAAPSPREPREAGEPAGRRPGAERAQPAARRPGAELARLGDDTAAPTPTRPARRRLGAGSPLSVAVGLLLLVAAAVGGVAIGRATASPDRAAPQVTSPSPAPASTAPGAVGKTPAACAAALADADQAFAYMLNNVQDQRLNQAIERYKRDRDACRAAK